MNLLALPRWAYGLIGLALAVAAVLAWHHIAVHKAVQRDREKAAVEAAQTARRADANSMSTVSKKSEAIENGNRAAASAAAESSDPLAAALHELRKRH